MKCIICGCALANSLQGKEAHMKRYHAITTEQPKLKPYKPMDPKELAEKTRRMEARLSGHIILDDKGDLKGYGIIVPAKEEVYPDLPTTDFGFEPKMQVIEPVAKVAESTEKQYLPQMSQDEFNRQLDALVDKTEASLKWMKETFGD